MDRQKLLQELNNLKACSDDIGLENGEVFGYEKAIDDVIELIDPAQKKPKTIQELIDNQNSYKDKQRGKG